MGPFQLVSGQPVFEVLFPFLPVNKLKIAPMVIGMAIDAFAVFRIGMESLSGINARLEQRMTGQAVLDSNLRPGGMALGAVAETFQECVGLMEISRR